MKPRLRITANVLVLIIGVISLMTIPVTAHPASSPVLDAANSWLIDPATPRGGGQFARSDIDALHPRPEYNVVILHQPPELVFQATASCSHN